MKINVSLLRIYKGFAVFTCITFLQASTAMASLTCQQLIKRLPTPKVTSPGLFLHQQNSQLHTTSNIEKAASSTANKTGEKLVKPADKITNWINYLDRVSQKSSGNEMAISQIKKYYYDQNLTKMNEVPESFFELQIKIAHEQGRGNSVMSKQMRKQSAEAALSDQKKSLENWIDYFLSKDAEHYPMWAKYWSMNGLAKLGKFNSELGTFGSRSKGQMSPFAELNREAYAMVIDAMVKKLNGSSLESIKDPEFIKLLQTESFGKLYGRALAYLGNKKIDIKSIDGEWRVYEQGSDHMPLVKSLEGKNTGWCTAGAATAQSQLAGGDFHVFYTKDEQGQMTQPRVAIRMDGTEIGEVRGIGANQNLDSKIIESSVIPNKMKEFGSRGDVYAKKTEHMQKLTEIEKANMAGQELSKEQLRFLLEMDNEIVGFGYSKDPRIKEIKLNRDLRSDLAKILDLNPTKISLNHEEALGGDIEYHYGDLMFFEHVPEGLVLPKVVQGSLVFSMQYKAKGIVMPEFIGGELRMIELTTAEALVLPKSVKGNVELWELRSAEGIVFPESVGGDLTVGRLVKTKGLVFPKHVGGKISIHETVDIKKLQFPKNFDQTSRLIRSNLDL